MGRTIFTLSLLVISSFTAQLSIAQELSDYSSSSFKVRSFNFEPLLQRFSNAVNTNTGLTSSFLNGQSAITLTGANTYDMSLWAIATPYSERVIHTYARNSIEVNGPDFPQTFSKGYSPIGGVLSFIRLKEFDQPVWWQTWEWSVKAGENAWIGIAAIRQYVQSGDSWSLDFAKERAEFILSLQDIDGAVRMGPRGQYFPFLKEGWWSIKSTENNESSLYFFDQLYLVTKEERYKRAADRIYNWLMDKMLDTRVGIFHRGAVFPASTWRIDGHSSFSPDTLTFAPIERMLNDARFGSSNLDRMKVLSRMMAETEKRCGVFSKDGLIGLSFSSKTKRDGVVSPEWTAQYILFCNHMADEYRKVGALGESQRNEDKSRSLLESMKKWYVQNDYVLPYALYYKNGYAAESIPTGHGWDTPDSSAALSSTIYFGFAAKGFDPLRDLISR